MTNLKGNKADYFGRLPKPDNMTGKTVHDRVTQVLRIGIQENILPANLRLNQGKLAASLNVSVTPVREALRDLLSEGLVIMDPRKGAIVAGLTMSDFHQANLLMEALEKVWAQLVVEAITDEEIDEAERLQEQMRKDPSTYVLLNTEFHNVLTAAARSPRLASMLEVLRAFGARVLNTALTHVPERIAEGIFEHEAILTGLRKRSRKDVAAAVLAHARPTWRIFEEILQASEKKAE